MGTRAVGAGSGSRSLVPGLMQQEIRAQAVHTTAQAAVERSDGAHGPSLLGHCKTCQVAASVK